ncbi:hypothetical protein [Burkholderia sp. Bp8963]|uniref:hypothetical protein n=1 Tax=Burkholderia sp. Bp8963 TaxID=2184547 RepID=UPI000F5A7E18|nr:hypothetical protein [Burkholderia sp. Bp8963]
MLISPGRTRAAQSSRADASKRCVRETNARRPFLAIVSALPVSRSYVQIERPGIFTLAFCTANAPVRALHDARQGRTVRPPARPARRTDF